MLKAIAYAETHFDNHNGEPSIDNGYGVMHLADNNENQSLNRAAAILQVPADVLKKDDWQNIRGGAAILREYANQEGLTAADRKNIEAWYPVVALYTNASSQSLAKFYADEIYKLLQSGFSGTTPNGEVIIVVAIDVKPECGELEGDVASRIE